MAAAPSEFQWLTLILAAVGAITGVFAAVWNVVQHTSAGSKIRVTVDYVYDLANGPVLEVNVYNKRRGAIEVRRWGVMTSAPKTSRMRTRGLQHFQLVELSSGMKGSDEASKTIQGGHGATWKVQFRDLNGFEANKNSWVIFRGSVLLGNGKRKISKRLRLQPGALHQTPRVIES